MNNTALLAIAAVGGLFLFSRNDTSNGSAGGTIPGGGNANSGTIGTGQFSLQALLNSEPVFIDGAAVPVLFLIDRGWFEVLVDGNPIWMSPQAAAIYHEEQDTLHWSTVFNSTLTTAVNAWTTLGIPFP